MHKEAQQAAGGLTSLSATSEEGAHPQLNSDQTKSTGDRLKTDHTDLGTNEVSRSDEISKKIKLEDLLDLMKDTRSAFYTPDSPQYEAIIISDESEEVETKKDEDTHTTSHDVHVLQSQKGKLEKQKAKAEAEVASLKVRPLYLDINQLTELLLKKHVQDMEIELSGDLKEILKKLETFTSTISSLTSQPSPLKRASSWCSICLIRCRFTCEEMRILSLELVFSLPCEFRSSSRVPMNFDDKGTTML
ncbi:hypothetical protein Tco_1146033 [Tanacetum coccineum]